MNTPLRDDLADFIQISYRTTMGVSRTRALKLADQFLDLVASKMPEKKDGIKNLMLMAEDNGYNQAITEVKSILRGSDDN